MTLRSLLFGRERGVRATLWAQITGRFDPDAVLAAARGAVATAADLPASKGERVSLLRLDQIPRGGVTEALLDGEPVAVCKVGDQVYVLDNDCPHSGGPLGDGDLQGHTLSCPFHGWTFDVRDGICTLDATQRVKTWPAEVVDGVVVVTRTA